MTISAIIIIIVAAVVLLVVINLSSRAAVKCVDKAHFMHEWNDIVGYSKDSKTRPMSVINADKLLDEALKGLGYKGETMAERLVSAKHQLKSKDAVWSAHKLRNKIVHETDHKASEKEVTTALQGYYRAFRELGVF